MISIQEQNFDIGLLLKIARQESGDVGAMVSFTGLVREMGEATDSSAMTLEHYPGMTEKVLQDIADEASERWSLLHTSIVHRVGKLSAHQQIVAVITSAVHRQQAFEAAEYIMDRLKTEAPFWKKEHGVDGDYWVEARQSDQQAFERWTDDKVNAA